MNQLASAGAEPCLSKSFSLHDVADPASPLILASPHSGRSYPASFLAQSRLDLLALRRSEDAYMDRLVGDAPSLGIPLLCAEFPRAFCDVNRFAWELDQGMFSDPLPPESITDSDKVRSGLGMIARIAGAGRGIYRNRLPVSEAHERIARYWLPYHTALDDLMRRTHARFGCCVLLDMHSMPTLPHLRLPDCILGDLHGTSCSADLVTGLSDAMRRAGFSVGRNKPYAGGYITARYGAPQQGMHVIQVEIGRALYLDESRIEPLAEFCTLRRRLRDVLDASMTLAGNMALS